MSNKNDFHSLLSVFRDATTAPPSSSGSGKSSGGDRQHQRGNGRGEQQQNRVTGAQKTPLNSSADNEESTNEVIDSTSTKDPSFSAPILKERIERILRIQQIRRSTTSGNNDAKDGNNKSCNNTTNTTQMKSSVHIAICATIVDDFPQERLWRKWMEDTGGEFIISEDDDCFANNAHQNTDATTGMKGDGGGEAVEEHIKSESSKMTMMASAEMHVHAKNPERVGSEWLRSKTLTITHRPNWNDVRIIRAILSLIEAALRDGRATHLLLCTESCIPVATLKEVARSVLLDEVCPWEEEMSDGHSGESQKQRNSNRSKRRELNWDRSYVDCYDRKSSRCTRFDEHNCWDILRNSVPSEIVYKALPGWGLISRKHAQSILNLPSQLGGMNLWPAFERVWAPEEVFIPTALAICGHMNDDEVPRRALTHSQWDARAADHKDRAHPLSYDGRFDDELVKRVRRDGCLFMRKMKRPLDLAVWEEIVVHHKRGRDNGSTMMPAQQGLDNRGRDWDTETGRGGGRGWERHNNDHRSGRDTRSYHSTSGYNDSRNRSHDSSRRHDDDDHHRHKRGRGDSSSYDNSLKRQQRGRR